MKNNNHLEITDRTADERIAALKTGHSYMKRRKTYAREGIEIDVSTLADRVGAAWWRSTQLVAREQASKRLSESLFFGCGGI